MDCQDPQDLTSEVTDAIVQVFADTRVAATLKEFGDHIGLPGGADGELTLCS